MDVIFQKLHGELDVVERPKICFHPLCTCLVWIPVGLLNLVGLFVRL